MRKLAVHQHSMHAFARKRLKFHKFPRGDNPDPCGAQGEGTSTFSRTNVIISSCTPDAMTQSSLQHFHRFTRMAEVIGRIAYMIDRKLSIMRNAYKIYLTRFI